MVLVCLLLSFSLCVCLCVDGGGVVDDGAAACELQFPTDPRGHQDLLATHARTFFLEMADEGGVA